MSRLTVEGGREGGRKAGRLEGIAPHVQILDLPPACNT